MEHSMLEAEEPDQHVEVDHVERTDQEDEYEDGYRLAHQVGSSSPSSSFVSESDSLSDIEG